MARQDVDLIIRAKDEAASVVKEITNALNAFRDAQKGVTQDSSKTQTALGQLGAALGTLAKNVKGLDIGSTLGGQMEKAQTAATKLEAKVADLSAEFSTLTKKTSDATTQADRLQQKLTGATTAYAKQKTAISETKKEVAALSDAYNQSSAAQDRMASRAAKLAQQIVEQQAKVQQSQTRSGLLNDQLAGTAKPSATLVGNANSAAADVATQTTKLAELQAAYAKADSAARAAGSASAIFGGQTEAATAKLVAETTVLDKIGVNVEQLGVKTKVAKQAQTDLTAVTAKVGTTLAGQTAQLDRARTELVTLAEATDTARAALGELSKASLGTLSQQITDQRRTMLEAKRDYVTFTTAATDMATAIGKAGVPTREMSAALDTNIAKARQAKQTYSDAKVTLELLGRTYRATGEDLTSIQQSQQKFNSLLAGQTESVNSSKAALQTEINSIMKLHSVSEEASSSTRNYGTARRNANSADDAGTAGTNSLAQAYKNLYGNSRQALSYTQRLRSEVLSLVTAYFGFYSIIDILKSTVDAYQTLQAAEFRLNAANQGDKSATGQDLDFIRRAADKLGISMGVLADEYSKFAVATIGTILQGDNTRKIFLSVAQAARVLHLSASDTQGVFLALTEIVSKGAVQMEELRRQLGNRLPGALQIMADGLKVSTAELIQMMSQGEITAAALIPFADELNKRFGSTLTDSLSSTQTELGKLSNAIFEALLAFGNAGFLQSFNKLLADLTTMLKDPGFSTFAALMSRVIASLVSGLDFAAQHFQIFVGLISAFIGLKTVPIFVAIAEKVMNLGKVFTVLSGTFTTVVSTERAVAIAMAEAGVAAETTSVGVRGLTAAMRVLTSSTGIGLAITAISFAIGAWATSADDATTALAEHQKIVDDVKNSYDDAKAAAKSWSDVVKSTTQSQAAANLADLQASLQKSRQQVLDPATTFNIYGGAAGGLAGSKNATGTAQSKQQLTDLINLFRSGGINAQAFKNGLEAVGSADETVSKQLIVDLENRADKTAELEKATNEMMAVLTLANKDATDQSKELALETLGLVNKQRQQTEQEIKATAQSQAYATAMETLTTATDSASGALEKLKAAANIESAFKSAVNAARTMGEVAAAIERANSALDALNQKDIASKYAAYGSGGGMDGGASAAFIRDRESFASTPYNDPRTDGQGNQVGGNIYRAGFGSNTITLADGTVQEITQGMRVSVADANRDLIRRIGELQTGLSNTLGADKFNSMTPQQQAALTSIAYNYGSLPKDIADAIKSGMTDAQVADVIRGHGGDNGGINRDRRGMEASMFNSTTNPAIVDEALKKQDAAVQKAAEFNTELAQTLAEQQAQLENQGKITREVAQSKAVEEEVKKAKAAGVVLTKEQIAQISDLAGKIWDQKHADDAANTALAQANALYKERNALQAQLNDARSKGDKGKVDDLGTKLTDVNAQLSDAIDKAEAMWKAIGGDQADVAITKLEALKAQSAKTSNTMYMDFQKVAGMIVDGLGSAFDSFSQQIAQGVAPLVALRDAFLKFASDFLVQIAQMILKQAIFNALNTMLGGTSLGAAIGLAHTGGIVGQSRVGSGNSSRSVSPMVFAGAQRFHGGGFPGLAPGEVPAIVQTGEEILKRNDPRNALNGAAGKGGSGAPAQNKIKIVNLFDTGALLQAALDTEVGQQVLFNFMSDNKAALGGVG